MSKNSKKICHQLTTGPIAVLTKEPGSRNESVPAIAKPVPWTIHTLDFFFVRMAMLLTGCIQDLRWVSYQVKRRAAISITGCHISVVLQQQLHYDHMSSGSCPAHLFLVIL